MRRVFPLRIRSRTSKLLFWVFLLFLLNFFPGVSHLGSTPPPDTFFEAPELLCIIEHYMQSGPNGARGDILCASETPGIDFLFLGTEWYRSLMDLPDCDCDLDFDTYTGCEEILLCINPATNDTDGDCLADNLEIFLGLDPTEADTDRDGILDGDEDPDEDGRSLRDEDEDGEGLTNCQETTIGTNPLATDTDGDGFSDGAEVTTDTLQPISDPLDLLSIPDLFFSAGDQIRINLPGNGGDLPPVTNMAGNPVGIYIPGKAGDLPGATELAQPPVTVEINSAP